MKKEILQQKEAEYHSLKLNSKLSEKEIFDKIFKNIENETLFGSNKILVYMGTYNSKGDYTCDWNHIEEFLVNRIDACATHCKYKDLENGNVYRIAIDVANEFEKNNLIVNIPNARHFENEKTYEEDYYKLRRIFCEKSIKQGQEQAISTVTSKESIEELFSVQNYMKDHNIDLAKYQVYNSVAICNLNKREQKPKHSKLILKKIKK